MKITTSKFRFNPKTHNWEKIELECYKHPSLRREYIKQLLEVEKNPNCTKKSVLVALYGKVKNFGTFDDLAQKGMVEKTGVGKYKAPLYSITLKGYALLFNVIGVPDKLFEDVNEMIQLNRGYSSLEEFDINCSLAGVHSKFEHFTSREFIESLHALEFADNPRFTRIFRRFIFHFFPFYTDICKRLEVEPIGLDAA